MEPRKTQTLIDLPRLYREIKSDVSKIGESLQPLAVNWGPLLDPTKELVVYLAKQLKEMSDKGDKDPSMDNFILEVVSALDKLKPVIEELSKGNRKIPQLMYSMHILLEHFPKLLMFFDKLHYHHTVRDALPKADELTLEFPEFVLAHLKKSLPQYDVFRVKLEKLYEQFDFLDGIEEFKKRSYIEKLAALVAFEELNKLLEIVLLGLNRISLLGGIREGYLLSRTLFKNSKYSKLNELSVNQLCEEFTRFYLQALAEVEIPLPPTQALYPFQNAILDQQNAMLAEHLGDVNVNKKIAYVKKTTKDTILRITDKELLAATKKNKANVALFLGFLNNKSELDIDVATKESFEQCLEHDKSFELDKDYVVRIDTILNNMKQTVAQLKAKAKTTQDYIELRIKNSEAKLDEVKIENPVEDQPSYTDIKNVLVDIYEQAKKINDLISGRDKKVNEKTESRIEKVLQVIYSQLEVMLDRNIYLQFIQRSTCEDGVKFVGDGWVKSIGASLHQVKKVFDRYKELKAYFSEPRRPSPHFDHSPKKGILEFAKKTQALAIVSKELVASIIDLEKDPFVKNLLSLSSIKQVIYQGAQIEVIEENSDELEDGQAWDIIEEAPKAITAVFSTLTNYYEENARKHLQTQFQISNTIKSIALIQRLQLEYDDLKKLPHNSIEVSTAQMSGFLLKNAANLHALLLMLADSYDAVSSLLGKEFSILIDEVNDAMEGLVLLCERIEIEFNLTQGYFTQRPLEGLFSEDLREVLKVNEIPEMLRKHSFHDLMVLCNSKLESSGFTFKKKYPFFSQRIEQLESLFSKAPLNTIKRNYIAYTLHKSREAWRHDKREQKQKAIQQISEHGSSFNNIINSAIAKLDTQLNANNLIRKFLLSKVLQTGVNIETLDSMVDKIALDPVDGKNIHLLYSDHCHGLMSTLHAETTSRADILTELELAISQLSEKRAQSYYFHVQSRRTELEATIQAYKDLNLFMRRPGTKVNTFKSESPVQFNLLVKYDKKLLEKLLQFTNQSFFLNNEKLIAGDVLPPVEELSPINAQDRLNQQTTLIDIRLQELTKTSYVTPIRAKKIALLNELATQLGAHTLTAALRKIQKNPLFSADYYLLHEGKTGKMVDRLTHLDMAKKDILKVIDLEILRLKNSRYETLYFFEKYRKSVIEERIQACLALKNAFKTTADGSRFNTVLATISNEHRTCLHKHEATLVNKLLNIEYTKDYAQPARKPLSL
jgi:hypothetical protein